jgi:rifampicin phosphotransferase
MTATYVRDLADEGLGLSEIGGKGQSLARLATAGVPVPHGFHITTAAYDEFVAKHDLAGSIQEQLAILNESAAGELIRQHLPSPPGSPHTTSPQRSRRR